MFRVLFDACVLVPYDLCNLLLTLAEHELFSPVWSEQILAETERALIEKLNIPPNKAQKRIGAMLGAFPAAMINNYADLIKIMRCHRKDRHVLAAAVRGNAQLLVTANIDDFPEIAAEPYDIEIVHPDPFLTDQLDLDPSRTMQAIQNTAERYNRPQLDTLGLMRRLRPTVPHFAQYVGMQLARGEPIGDTAMLVQSTPEEAFVSFAPGGNLDVRNPASVGWMWYASLLNLPEDQDIFDYLCLNPADWKNPATLAERLEGYALASEVDPAIEAPDRMAFMRLITTPGTVSQVFQPGVVRGPMAVLTLVQHDGDWKVFSIGPEFIPANRVFTNWSQRGGTS